MSNGTRMVGGYRINSMAGDQRWAEHVIDVKTNKQVAIFFGGTVEIAQARLKDWLEMIQVKDALKQAVAECQRLTDTINANAPDPANALTTPAADALANKHGIDLDKVNIKGTGADGKVVKSDVEAYIETHDADGNDNPPKYQTPKTHDAEPILASE